MPVRRYCDICDRKFGEKEAEFSLRISLKTPDGHDYYRSDSVEYFDSTARHNKPIEYDSHMVCRACIVAIRSAVEEEKRNALQKREAKEVPLGEKAQDS